MGQFSLECCVGKRREGKRVWRKPAIPVSQSVSGREVKARLQIDVEERCFPFQSNQRESGISSRGADFPVSGRVAGPIPVIRDNKLSLQSTKTVIFQILCSHW